MMDQILSELQLQEALYQLSIAPAYFSKLVSVPVHSQSTNFAVDIRSDSVVVSSQS